MTTPDRTPTRITPREFLIASVSVHVLFFVLRFTYMWLDDVVRGVSNTFLPTFVEELSGALGSALLSVFIYLAWCRSPWRTEQVWRHVPGYLTLGVLLSFANTSFMWGSRSVAFPLLGLGHYDYGRMPLRYFMELPGSLIGFATVLTMIALTDEVRARRARHTQQLELERELAESQLRALRLQMQPHFLFNALNTISAQLHENPAVADRLIGHLSDLLRASLRSTHGAEVPLRDELALLDDYAALMHARFGERLCLAVESDHRLADVRVPPVLLQPLVENAIRHGGLERQGVARIRVHIARDAGTLTLQVHDDGPGIAHGRDPLASGTGLSTTARRLELLHGSAARIQAGNDPRGGFLVRITLPIT
ncbi:sensor histidine kinase [Gemmatimonas sp.]|uniref:sensor histidine kinase n=1 Tax=Gemmatimonas sp. TaxID=1962908 RepID=UPI00398398B8